MDFQNRPSKIYENHTVVCEVSAKAYLGYCTEVEYGLVPDPRHVLDDVRYMLQSVCDELIEARDCRGEVLLLPEVT